MFLLFGFRTVLKDLPGRPATCQSCGRLVHHYLQERSTKFTLFFIPVFTTSRTYQVTCSHCGTPSTTKALRK